MLARNEDWEKKYHKTVKQYIDNNHATKIPPEDLYSTSGCTESVQTR